MVICSRQVAPFKIGWSEIKSRQHTKPPAGQSHRYAHPPYDIFLFSVLVITFAFTHGYAQNNSSNSTIFYKPSLNQLKQDMAPSQSGFTPVTFTPAITNNNYKPILGNNSIEQQNRNILQRQGMLPGQNTQQQELQNLKQEIREDENKEKENRYLSMAKPFQDNFQQFMQMNPDSFSISKAVYLSENAWYNNPPSYDQFLNAVKAKAGLVKQILKSEGLKDHNNTAMNYAIQKLYSQDNTFISPETKNLVTVPKCGYDFNDYMGDKNWSNMFVTKLLATGKGQCHSLPLLYLCVAEQLGSKAYLSLSPGHSFIQYFDDKGYRYNFETTNGNLVTQAWLMQSSYVNATALKNKTYLDTLSNRNLYAQILSDLLQNYLDKVGYDDNAKQISNAIFAIDPNNIAALMIQANHNTFIANRAIKQAGYPPKEQMPNYPEVNGAWQQMLQSYQRIEETGFQDMPEEAYEAWLETMEQEKKKEANKQMQQRQKREIEILKKLKPKIIHAPKG